MSSGPFYPYPPQSRPLPGLSPTIGADQQSEGWARRVAMIRTNRAYYDGTQFDAQNDVLFQQLGCTADQVLPEHERLHEYSIAIQECVDFIATQLTDGFTFVASDPTVQALIDQACQSTDLLANESDEDMPFDDLIIEAAQAGDVVYETRWDPITGAAFWEFWPAEDVEFTVPWGRHVEKVTRRMQKIVDVVEAGIVVQKEVTETKIYELRVHVFNEAEIEAGQAVAPEYAYDCHVETLWNQDTIAEDWLGLPFIPWGIIRGDRQGLRGFRGDPLIRPITRKMADRYNANEQTAWKIARYNSHASLVVIGDQAYLKIEKEKKVHRDVADVLPYPEGTNAFGLTLPTDPAMIQHTHDVCLNGIYSSFGLVRVEPDTIQGIGAQSGYSLEILNRKSEGKLKRIRRVWKTDTLMMLNQMLDMTAVKQGATQFTDLLVQEGDREELPVVAGPKWWEIEPKSVYPNREIEIRMGAGYVVDDVMARDDFTAQAISQQEFLRLRGYGDEEIKKIMEEQAEAKAEAQERFQAQLDAQARLAEQTQATSVKAGDTIGSTER